jgi:multiple sugar transport system substrate-binding protein
MMAYRIVGCMTALLLLVLAVQGQTEETIQDVVVWSVDFSPALVQRQQTLLGAFAEQNPQANIEFVVMDTVMMEQMMDLAVAAGTPPDLLIHPLEITYRFNQNQIFDTAFTTELIEELGADTFSANALRLLRDQEGRYMALPLYGEPLALLFRADWFDASDLPAPDNFERIRDAAQTLHDPDNGRFGFCGPTQRNELLINMILEELALANGVRFVDAEGKLTVATPAYAEALALYADLIRETGQTGASWTADDVRNGYLSGACAMIMWPLSIIDEIAGLQERYMPTCPECTEQNPNFLPDNTGTITYINNTESEASRARYDMQVLGIYWGSSDAAHDFMRYFVEQEYIDWVNLQPEVRIPLRYGVTPEDDSFHEQWSELNIGVEMQRPIAELYEPSKIESILASVDAAGRLGSSTAYPRMMEYLNASHIRGAILGVIDGERLKPEQAALAIEAGIRAEVLFENLARSRNQ